MKTITVFGSAQVRPTDPLYATAETIGRDLAQAGYRVMTGGYYGLMEAVSKGASDAGGCVCGVTTDQIGLQFDLQPNAYNGEIVHFADLRDRLSYMVQNADAYLAMPGGAGTLHEIAETWELTRIGGIPARPFVCYGELWREIIGRLIDSPFLGPDYAATITLASTRAEIMSALRNGADR